MGNPKISKKSVHKLWTKVLLPELRQKLTGGIEALRQASHDVGAIADKAKSLIDYHVAPIAQQLQESAKNFQTNDTLEMSYLRYQKRWESMALTQQDKQLLQSGYVYLGRWKLDQMQRVTKGLPVEDPIGFEMFQTVSDTIAMFEFRESEPLVAHKAGRVASFSSSSPLVGGILDKTPVPVWSIYSSDKAKSAKFGFGYLRTAVVENWSVHDNQGQSVLGTLEAVPFNETDLKDVWLLDASATGKLIPLPTPLDEYGLPTIHYGIDPSRENHVVWSPKAGQFFLVLDTEALEPTSIYVVAYTTIGVNPLHLTPHGEDPSLVTTTTRPEELSDYTRQVFEDAKRMGDRSMFGAYALGEYEQLQYASEKLKKSWDYEWTPKNMNEFLAAGKPILQNLHKKGAIETANCALANMEFAEAARVFGYKVRFVQGFLGSNEKSIDAPGHMWTEAYVDGHWKELDVTPIGQAHVYLSDAIGNAARILVKIGYDPKWMSVLDRLSDPNFQSTSDSLMVLAKDMLQIPGEVISRVDQPTTVVGYRHIFDVNFVSPQEMQVKVYDSLLDRIATKGAYLGDFEIQTTAQKINENDVRSALYGFSNCASLLVSLNNDEDYTTIDNGPYSIRLGSFVEPQESTKSVQRYKSVGELKFALQKSKLSELKGELRGNKDERIVIPGYSRQFTVCSDLECVRKEFKLPSTTPDSVVVDLLTSLRFMSVKAEDGNEETLRYAFNPKAELVLRFDDFNNSNFGDVNFRFGPMGERLLTIPSVVSTDDNGRYENMATKFAALLFTRAKGRPVPSEDRHLLKQALHLMLRHPPELKRPLDIVMAAYVMDEARRHQLSEESFVSVMGLPSSQFKQCDIMKGCEIKPGSKDTSESKPLSSINAIMLEVAKSVEDRRKLRQLEKTNLPPEYHAWFEGFLARNFRPRAL